MDEPSKVDHLSKMLTRIVMQNGVKMGAKLAMPCLATECQYQVEVTIVDIDYCTKGCHAFVTIEGECPDSHYSSITFGTPAAILAEGKAICN